MIEGRRRQMGWGREAGRGREHASVLAGKS